MHPFRTAAGIVKFARRDDPGQLSERPRFPARRGLSRLVARPAPACHPHRTPDPRDLERPRQHCYTATAWGGGDARVWVVLGRAAAGFGTRGPVRSTR